MYCVSYAERLNNERAHHIALLMKFGYGCLHLSHYVNGTEKIVRILFYVLCTIYLNYLTFSFQTMSNKEKSFSCLFIFTWHNRTTNNSTIWRIDGSVEGSKEWRRTKPNESNRKRIPTPKIERKDLLSCIPTPRNGKLLLLLFFVILKAINSMNTVIVVACHGFVLFCMWNTWCCGWEFVCVCL